MDYFKGKIGEFEDNEANNDEKKRKVGRPVSEYDHKIAVYITKEMLDYINLASKFEPDRSAYIRRLVSEDMELHKEEYEHIFNRGTK